MKKELIICLIIIAVIIVGDIFIQKYTVNTLSEVENNLNNLKENLENYDYSKLKIEKIDDNFNNNFHILSCFLEHNELEKIKTRYCFNKSRY